MSETNKPANPAAGQGVIPPKRSPRAVQSVMQRLAQEALGKGAKLVPDDEGFRHDFPNLFDWLTATQISDDFEKDRARLGFTVEGTYWRITLNDSALECSLSALGNTFRAALAALEEAVVHPDAPWQRFKQRNRKALRELQHENGEGGGQKRKK